MAKRRTYKRDKRGRFSETLGGLASKARGNGTSLSKGVRGKNPARTRRDKLVDKKIARLERRRNRTNAHFRSEHATTQNGKPLAESTRKREIAYTNKVFNTSISNLRNYGRMNPGKRRVARVTKRGRVGQYGTRV